MRIYHVDFTGNVSQSYKSRQSTVGPGRPLPPGGPGAPRSPPSPFSPIFPAGPCFPSFPCNKEIYIFVVFKSTSEY